MVICDLGVANLPPFVASSSCVDISFFNTWLITGRGRIPREVLPTVLIIELMINNRKRKSRATAQPLSLLLSDLRRLKTLFACLWMWNQGGFWETRDPAIHAC